MLKIITKLCLFLVGTLAPTQVAVTKETSAKEFADGIPTRAIPLCPAIGPQHGIIQSKSGAVAYFNPPTASSKLKVEL